MTLNIKQILFRSVSETSMFVAHRVFPQLRKKIARKSFLEGLTKTVFCCAKVPLHDHSRQENMLSSILPHNRFFHIRSVTENRTVRKAVQDGRILPLLYPILRIEARRKKKHPTFTVQNQLS